MKKRWALPLLPLALALLLLAAAAVKTEASLSRAGDGWLLLPRQGGEEPAPAVLLLWGNGEEKRSSLEMAVELTGRGYAAIIAPGESAGAAWAALEEHPRVFAGSMAALGWPESHSALNALARSLEESETKPRALLYLGAESAPDTPSGQNVLCILRGAEESAGTLEGYFAEGSARRTVTPAQQDGREWRRAALPHVCNWLGSSLGHPRDGVYGYDESLSAPCRALLLAAAVCALLSLLSLPFALWKKRGHGA